jgi:hypothetical protein
MTPSLAPAAPAAPSSRPVAAGTLIWLALAVAVGASGRLTTLAPPGPQLVILALTVAAVVIGTRVQAVRSWVDAVPLRTMVGMHAVRFVGAWFLALSAQGLLSTLFAERAGWGDIAAAALALALVAAVSPVTRGGRAAYLAWNVFGVLDLALAVGTASWVAVHGLEPGIQPILRLPLSLVPTFLVPILFASHVIMFRRLLAGGGAGAR